MSYGMKNARATFQRPMNTASSGKERCCVHRWRHGVYWRLGPSPPSAATVTVTPTGCQPSSQHQEVRLCVCPRAVPGVRGLIYPPSSKVEAIQNFKRPQNRRELRCFLGCIGYYRRIFKNFATVVAPLTELFRKGIKFEWSNEWEESFENAKDIFTNYPVMTAPMWEQERFWCSRMNREWNILSLIIERGSSLVREIILWSKRNS